MAVANTLRPAAGIDQLKLRGVLLFAVWLGVSVGLNSVASLAQQGSGAARVEFDIAAQPLDQALETYMQATGLQVLYRSDLTASLTSNVVRGRLEPREALHQLLTGTGLTARYTAEGAFTVVATAVGGARDAMPSPGRLVADYESYLGYVQQQIIASLCRNTATRLGQYRAALQFTIGPSGNLEDASLIGSTGDAARDGTIARVLQTVAVDAAPPAQMPQPVTMLIVPRQDGRPDECLRYSASPLSGRRN
jgi:TonB family protein